MGASLVLAAGLSAGTADAEKASQAPAPEPRPTSSHVVPKTITGHAHGKTTAPAHGKTSTPDKDKATAAPAIQPATRQHAVLPPPAKRKPVPRAAMAATSSTSRADLNALEHV